jgi:hypothetical protein
MILQARCNKGRGECRINLEVPDGDGKTPVYIPVYYACSAPDCNKHEHLGVDPDDHYGPRQIYQGTIYWKDAGPYLVRCVAHREMMHFRKLKTSRSSDLCSADCTHAGGDKCKCSCGGLNHGIEA